MDQTLEGQLERVIEAAGSELLHPRMVEEALGITGRERIRRTKARKLPRLGIGSFSTGWRKVYFWFCSAAAITDLVRHPATIEDWRREDAMKASAVLVTKSPQSTD